MSGIIHNIMTLYEMRAKALGVLIADTEKALKQCAPDNEKTLNEQAERLENFVKNLTGDANNILTRFWFQKERKRMTDGQVKVLTDFVSFTQSLTEKVRELLTCFQNSETFEKTNERQLQQLQAHVEQKLKEFDEALDGTSDTLKKRLSKRVGNVVSGLAKPFGGKVFDTEKVKKATQDTVARLSKVSQT